MIYIIISLSKFTFKLILLKIIWQIKVNLRMLTFLITIQKLELLYKNFVFFQLIIMVIEITLDHLKIKLLLTLLYFERVKCCGIIKHVESLIVFFLIYIQVQIIFVWLIYIYSLVLSFFKFVLNTVVYARVIFTHSIWA